MKIARTTPTKPSIKTLLKELTAVRRKLFKQRVRDYSDYAEILVAHALGGARHKSRTVRGNDILAPSLNRVEVRSRMLPLSGKSETRVPLKAGSRGLFDWLAVPIFRSNGEIEAAYLLPHDAAWELADASKYSRLPLGRAMAHAAAKDITSELRAADFALGAVPA